MSIARPGLEQIDPGSVADGTYSLTVTGGTITSLSPVPTSVQVIVPGVNISVDNTDPTHPVVEATGPKELLMADGVTSPPVPIETEAGDDWLYQD